MIKLIIIIVILIVILNKCFISDFGNSNKSNKSIYKNNGFASDDAKYTMPVIQNNIIRGVFVNITV